MGQKLYIADNPTTSIAFASMGQLHYLSALRLVDGVVGNSSSGIIQAPSFRIGTINIGDRQKGRAKAESVIDCAPEKAALVEAISKLYSEEFQAKLKKVKNPYGEGNTSAKILDILKRYELKGILKKHFYDLNR